MAVKMTGVELDDEMQGMIEVLRDKLGKKSKSYIIRRGIELLMELQPHVDQELDTVTLQSADGKIRAIGYSKMLPKVRRSA